MALVTSVVFLSCGASDEVGEFLRLNYPKIGEAKPLHFGSSGPKCCEIDIRAVGFNYLDVDQFYRLFDDFPWIDLPTLVVRERESDLLSVRIGSEARDEGLKARIKDLNVEKESIRLRASEYAGYFSSAKERIKVLEGALAKQVDEMRDGGCLRIAPPREFDSAPKDGTEILAFCVDYQSWIGTSWNDDVDGPRWSSELSTPEFSHWIQEIPDPDKWPARQVEDLDKVTADIESGPLHRKFCLQLTCKCGMNIVFVGPEPSHNGVKCCCGVLHKYPGDGAFADKDDAEQSPEKVTSQPLPSDALPRERPKLETLRKCRDRVTFLFENQPEAPVRFDSLHEAMNTVVAAIEEAGSNGR